MDVLDKVSIDKEGAREYLEKYGVSGIDDFFKRKLEEWKDVEIIIGITGDSGTGKSSFINAIRGVDDEDELMAAKTDVTETTMEPSCYAHPTNSKIRFWDLPGIGTPKYPDLPTYCDKVELVKYDTFLIFTTGRFTDNDLKLAKKIRSIGKKFFFIRCKIDVDYDAEKRKKSFDEAVMLKKILDDCSKNLVDLLDDRGDLFLISNHYPAKWDFHRLTQAILDVLPIRQRECLTLSLTNLSTDILQRKIQVLKDRIWMVASASAVGGIVPIPGLSIAVDLVLITNEVSFYRSQLGLPEEGTREFDMMKPQNRERVRKLIFFFKTATEVASFMVADPSRQAAIEEASRLIPFEKMAIAGCVSFGSTYYILQRCLTEMEKTAISLLEDVTRKSVDDFDIA